MTSKTLSSSRAALLRGWVLLAIASLALAGLFAILLVLSRIPGMEDAVPWPTAFFHKGLVAHVVLSFAVWYLAVFGCLVQFAGSEDTNLLDKSGLALATLGTVLLLIPSLLDRGEPTLNNYIPVIIDPLYYSGLVLLALGILAGILCVFRNTPNGPNLKSAVFIYIMALVAFIIAESQLSNQPVSHDYNERLLWGGGHLLQFLNVALLLVAWSYLANIIGANAPYRWASLWLVIAGLAGLSFYVFWTVMDERQTQAFTDLQYALGPPVIIFAAGVLPILGQQLKNFRWQDPAMLSLWTSIVVFAAGGVLGFFVDGTDTRTPAHYHGVIAGINLAFVGLFYAVFLPKLGRVVPTGKLVTSQIILYAVGQFLFIVGMFIAGGMGAARKVMGTAIDMDQSIVVAAAGIRDFGGGLAIIGGLIFIYITLKALLRKLPQVNVETN
ncbi:MAG: cbb3-type cytochrome c oxidase subunit I [Rhodospirillales bacterium]|nr:cbb3-type cytochrome c oxidase subunit I [Rhodospirillales bacterium]